MCDLCNGTMCTVEPVLEKLNKDNFEKVICNSRLMLHREHLTLYHVDYTGKMKVNDGSWVDSVSYYSDNNYGEHYTRSINSFIENFIPIVLLPFEDRLINEKDNLYDKLVNLENFINENPKFQELDGKDKELMEKQLSAMSLYYVFLNQRIVKMLKAKIEEYDALPSTGEEVKADVAKPANVL